MKGLYSNFSEKCNKDRFFVTETIKDIAGLAYRSVGSKNEF
jgi:hypothetical protein